jgi:hypothetical protein
MFNSVSNSRILYLLTVSPDLSMETTFQWVRGLS